MDEGYYLDEEISLLAPSKILPWPLKKSFFFKLTYTFTEVLSWIKSEIGQLRYFEQTTHFERENFHKVINQRVTTPKYPQFTTPITTTKVTTGIVTGGSSYAGNYEGNSVLIVL